MSHSSHRRSRSALLVALMLGIPAAAVVAPAAAGATCVSTPATATLPDSTTDGSGIAPEITSLDVALDANCQAAFSFGIINQTDYIGTDFLGWFVDLDGNTATGSQTGFRGSDVALGRNASGMAAFSTYNASTASFVTTGSATTVGTWGAQVDLAPLAPFGVHAMTVAGGSSYTGSSGASYYDWAPDIGASPLGFIGSLASYVAPLPAPAAPAVAPTPVVAAPVPPVAICTIPKLHNVALGQAKVRLRKAGCKPGRVQRQTSSTVKQDRVIRSKLPAGRQVAVDRGVALVVSRGPATTRSAKAASAVPTALPAIEALNALAAAAGAR